MLFSEPKIPQSRDGRCGSGRAGVSVLFSEPKIPQLWNAAGARARRTLFQCSSASRKFLNLAVASDVMNAMESFSALQRAENSSIGRRRSGRVFGDIVSVLFSEPKIPQCSSRSPSARCGRCFSALQRAENSSIAGQMLFDQLVSAFQCSSASRKFLNACGIP